MLPRQLSNTPFLFAPVKLKLLHVRPTVKEQIQNFTRNETDDGWTLVSMELKIREKSRHKNLKLSIYPDSLVNSEDHDEMQLQ